MTDESSARLDILPSWRNLNDMLIELVDCVPDDKIDWSPKPELWSFHHIFQHLSEAREQWMNRAIADAETDIGAYENVHSKEEIKTALRLTWTRIERVFNDQTRLDTTYRDRYSEQQRRSGSGRAHRGCCRVALR